MGIRMDEAMAKKTHSHDLTQDEPVQRLVLVTGLDPENDVLSRHYEQIVSEWGQVTLADYGVGRLFDQFAYQDAAGYMEGGFPHFLPAAIKDGRPLKPERVSL